MDQGLPPSATGQMAQQQSGQHRAQMQHQQQQAPIENDFSMTNPSMVPQAAMPQMTEDQAMMRGDSLDDIIRNNHSEMSRRKSLSQTFDTPHLEDQRARRMSSFGTTSDVMTFDPSSGELGSFAFAPSMGPFQMSNQNLNMAEHMRGLGTQQNEYPALSAELMDSMNHGSLPGVDMNPMAGDAQMSLFSTPPSTGAIPTTSTMASNFPQGQQMPNMSTSFSTSAMTTDPLPGNPEASGNGNLPVPAPQMSAMNSMPGPAGDTTDANVGPAGFNQMLAPSLSPRVSSSDSVVSPQHGPSPLSATQTSSATGPATPVISATPRENKPKTIYSKSGFDMLKALWLVATRKDPKIHLGAVDMSCAFVVCDVTMNDCPIVYVSDNFQNLTGYSRHEIIGQNCRFLQAPDGKVEAGSKREFVDDGAVYNLKKMTQEGREVQQSLINYRKGGKPFLNLLTMIPIPWDTEEIRYFIGFQIDLVECPDAISGEELGGVKVNYKHSDIGQYIWTPPSSSQWEPENGQTLGVDDVSTLLQQFAPKGLASDWHKQSWDKMLLENSDDVVHVMSLKGLFLYLSPSSKKVLEYDAADLVGSSLSSICHPSDIVPVTRELKDATAGNQVNLVFRIRRKESGYTWFESHGSLFVEQGKGRKCIILVGRKRPVFALSRKTLEDNGGIGDSEFWTKLSTSGLFLFVSSNVRSLLDLQPESLVGTSIQDLMRKESRSEFGRSIEQARRGKIVTCKHEVQNRRGQGLQAQTTLYPGDAFEGQKPSFLLAQTKLLKASSRSLAPAGSTPGSKSGMATPGSDNGASRALTRSGQISQPAGGSLALGNQDAALAAEDNIFEELRTTKCSSWQFELRQMEKVNRILAEELGGLLSSKKKRKRRKGVGNLVRDCANCHTRNTPEWRRGPSGQRDLCNSCGLRWAKQTGRVSPRNSTKGGNNGNGDSHSKKSASPMASSPLHKEFSSEAPERQGTNCPTNDNASDGRSHSQSNNSGQSNAVAPKSNSAMPPPRQPTLAGGPINSVMTSIREERESSQP